MEDITFQISPRKLSRKMKLVQKKSILKDLWSEMLGPICLLITKELSIPGGKGQ